MVYMHIFQLSMMDLLKVQVPFENFKLPQYPCFIGNKFKSKPNDFNFKNNAYQGKYDIEGNGWLRNTTPCGLALDNVSYDFVTEPYKIYNEIIKSASYFCRNY